MDVWKPQKKTMCKCIICKQKVFYNIKLNRAPNSKNIYFIHRFSEDSNLGKRCLSLLSSRSVCTFSHLVNFEEVTFAIVEVEMVHNTRVQAYFCSAGKSRIMSITVIIYPTVAV